MTSKNEALLSFGIISGVIRALEPNLTESIHKVLITHCEMVMSYLMQGEGSFGPEPFTNLYVTNPCKSEDSPWEPGQVKCGDFVK